MIAREACGVALAIAGCYSPTYLDCQVTCGDDFACPSGLMCDMQAKACRSPNSQACVVDAGTDGGVTDAPCSSWHGIYPSSNFDPCDPLLPPSGSALDTYPFATIDTTNGMLVIGSGSPMTAGGTYHNIWVIHVPSITIDGVVTVTGTLPLLLVADTTISVAYTVTVTATSPNGADSCVAPNGIPTNSGGNGGGGGGYGTDGAQGGLAFGSTAPAGEGSNGSVSLVPLRFGCGGGTGGSPDTSAPGGAGGAAGAALELAAGTSITILQNGTLTAYGGGGSDGVSNGTFSSGGGGGGTGGSILLEAPMLTIDGAVCAPGGGGGQGGADSMAGSPGTTDSCAGGQGGDNTVSGGAGGDGGGMSAPISGVGDLSGGGGGGGGVGRIHFHAPPSGLAIGSGARLVPAAQ